MDRTLFALAIVGLGTGCPFEPEDGEVPEITGDDDSTDGTSSDPTLDDTGTSDDPVTTQPPDTSDTDDTPATCGDGSVDGDEVCDDGINDGSYGGCESDCSAFAPFCGDTEINGDEACDDGTNDGSYGGCASDCSALGPHCGDGELQRPELCDEGANNQNGSGCNVDCVTSGTVVGTYQLDGLDFCDGEFVTEPAFRADGNVLVGATGYCNDDSVALVELSTDVELVQEFDPLLPETPVREGTLVGDDWVLASYGCNYRIDPAGALDEVCGGRTSGSTALEAAADGSYIALDYDVLALYPSGSPMLGDAPSWTAIPPDNGSYDYYFSDATFGPNGSVIVVGTRNLVTGGPASGYIAHYTAAGNLVDDYSFGTATGFYRVARAPDGTVLVIGAYPSYGIFRLDAEFGQVWSLPVGVDAEIAPAIDSTDAVLLLYYDSTAQQHILRKLAPDGQSELWNLPLPNLGNDYRIAVDAEDSIWIATVTFPAALSVLKVSP
jgi:hypothetical protein